MQHTQRGRKTSQCTQGAARLYKRRAPQCGSVGPRSRRRRPPNRRGRNRRGRSGTARRGGVHKCGRALAAAAAAAGVVVQRLEWHVGAPLQPVVGLPGVARRALHNMLHARAEGGRCMESGETVGAGRGGRPSATSSFARRRTATKSATLRFCPCRRSPSSRRGATAGCCFRWSGARWRRAAAPATPP